MKKVNGVGDVVQIQGMSDNSGREQPAMGSGIWISRRMEWEMLKLRRRQTVDVLA